MPPHEIALEQNEYRLVLVRSGSHAIWAENNGGVLRLPRVAIPRWTRPAEQLQRTVESFWSFRSIILDILPGKKGSAPCAVVEILSYESPNRLSKVSVDDISNEELTNEERERVKVILAGDRGFHGQFSRLGWIEEAFEWVRGAVDRNVAFTGEVCQYNAVGGFVLIRFETQDCPAFWLKATSQPNVHEFHITKLLGEMCAEYLPRRVAERADWNAWLMEDAGRSPDVWAFPALEQAVLSMAGVQQRTVGWTGEFRTLGAFDQRDCVVREHLAELIEYLDEAMMKQSSTKVPRIERRRLWQIASILQEACFRMEALEVPNTLVHNDLNSGNILFRGTQCVFTDWCEIGVGSPFHALQYLCLLQPHGAENWIPKLREAYKQCWLDFLSPSDIDRAFTLMPLLAILSYLYGRGTWLRSPRRNAPHTESYARCLARHMDRAARDKDLLEALCH